MPCWLMRSVREYSYPLIWYEDGSSPNCAVLQGYIYLTDSYLCFFAHMPSKEVSLSVRVKLTRLDGAV